MSGNKRNLLAAVPLGNTGSPFTYDRLVGILEYLAETALLLALTIAMGAIVYYGFMMAMSKGDPGKFNEAKSALIKACIGAALILGVYTVINTVQGAANTLTN